jgi:type I restriction enzyme S subunit
MTWQRAPIGDLANRVTKGTTPTTLGYKFAENVIPFIRVQNLVNGKVDISREPLFIDNATHEALERSQIQEGDLLISIAGTIGRPAVVDLDTPLNCNQAVAIVRLNGSVDRKYVLHWLASADALSQMTAKGVTGTITNLSLTQIKSLNIPLPPLSDQKRIAAILDAADALRAKRRESLAQLDTLLQCTFLDMFGDCGRPPISIGEPTFGDPTRFVLLSGCARLATGHTPDREVLEYWGGDIPWVSLTDIRDLDGTIATTTGQNVTQRGIENSSAVTLPKGTVCFSRTASIGFVTVMGREMCTSQDFVNWVCGDELSPIYLMWALRLSRPYLLSKASGSTHKTIYYRHAEQFQVFLPPRDRQHRFATIVESVERQKARLRAHLAELDTLFASLQARAFNGEL